MSRETLNIERHRKELVFKALNKARNLSRAAQLLGVDVRSVHNLKTRYGFKRDVDGSYYEIVKVKA